MKHGHHGWVWQWGDEGKPKQSRSRVSGKYYGHFSDPTSQIAPKVCDATKLLQNCCALDRGELIIASHCQLLQAIANDSLCKKKKTQPLVCKAFQHLYFTASVTCCHSVCQCKASRWSFSQTKHTGQLIHSVWSPLCGLHQKSVYWVPKITNTVGVTVGG